MAIGLFTGFIAGLLGIGGGGILVPFLSALMIGHGVAASLAVKIGIATSLSIIVFTSLSSTRGHQKQKNVRWDVFLVMAPGIVIGDLLASMGLSAVLKGTVLAAIFAVFLLVTATRMALNRRPREGNHLPGRAGLFGAGGVIGFVSGLLGIGGGSLSVPFLSYCNIGIHRAVGTSAALGFPIAAAGTIGYILAGRHATGLPPHSFGYIWLPGLLIVAAGTVSMAPIGARAAGALPVTKLRRIFAVLLYVLGAYMLYQAVAG